MRTLTLSLRLPSLLNLSKQYRDFNAWLVPQFSEMSKELASELPVLEGWGGRMPEKNKSTTCVEGRLGKA